MRYWKKVDGQGNTTTVESYSHNLDVAGLTEISEAEFDAFVASLPSTPPSSNFLPLFSPLNPVQGVELRLAWVEEWLVERFG